MRKPKLITLLLIVTFLLVGVMSTSAQGVDGTGWWSNFTIQNTSASDATVSVTAYHLTGGSSSTYSSGVTLPTDGSVIFHPGLAANCSSPFVSGCRIGLTPDLPTGFEGSVAISSDQPVVAVSNLNNNQSGSVGASGGSARSAYQGIDSGLADTTLYFPTVKHNFAGQTTLFYVQAAGANSDVTITYNMNDGSAHAQTQTIEANKSFAFHPASATPAVASCNGGNGGGSDVADCFGGATVTASTPVAGVVVEYIDGASVADYVLATRGMTAADAGTTVLAPTMKYNFNGSSTGASILNAGTASATVDLAFSVTNVSSGDSSCTANIGDTATDQVTIAPGKSVVVNGIQGNIGGLDDCTFFSMVATSTESLIATVNESRLYQGQRVKAVYGTFSTANATTTAFFPLVKEFFNGQTTGVSVVNAGNAAATITGTYTCDSGTYTVTTASAVTDGAAASFFNLSGPNPNFTGDTVPADSKCAVVMSSAQPIVGISQESDRDSSNGTLDVYNAEGFNQ